MPNLRHLTVELYNTYRGDVRNCVRRRFDNICIRHRIYPLDKFLSHLNGIHWEQIIVSHLPKLGTFQLKMQYEYWTREKKDVAVHALIQSFGTHYWIHERRWFVRCEWNVDPSSPYFCLYTLPSTFTQYSTQYPVLMSKSTSPTDADYWCPDQMREL
jgi:hypothetical protein